jgi:hypothetical protein
MILLGDRAMAAEGNGAASCFAAVDALGGDSGHSPSACGGAGHPQPPHSFTLDHPLYAGDDFRIYAFK